MLREGLLGEVIVVRGEDVGDIVETVVAVAHGEGEGPTSAAAKGVGPAVATGRTVSPAELQQGGAVEVGPSVAALRVEYHLSWLHDRKVAHACLSGDDAAVLLLLELQRSIVGGEYGENRGCIRLFLHETAVCHVSS